MSDLIEFAGRSPEAIAADMVRIADASRREDGTDIPLGAQCREAAQALRAFQAENTRLREDMIGMGADATFAKIRAEAALAEAVAEREAAVLAEREACAQIVSSVPGDGAQIIRNHTVAAIRARTNMETNRDAG